MTMHPELEHAFDSGASMREVIEIFRKHHGGPMEGKLDFSNYSESPKNHEFWDQWAPLWHSLPKRSPLLQNPVSEPFLNIHRALTREVIAWLCDSKRKSSIYVIPERQTQALYAETDRRTRAAILANIYFDGHRFGLFIRDGSTAHALSSITVALAKHYPPYRRILTRVLIDNPGIHELPPCIRFKKLIHEPWKALQVSHPQYITTPPVIVLRWEYKRDGEDLLRSICEFGSRCSSLLWLISTNPSEIKLPIPHLLEPLAPFPCIRPPVRYNGASADASLILHHEFSALRHKYKDIFDEEVWPSEGQMSQLIRVVSGAVEFVDVIIQFVDWEHDGGPPAHLEAFLGYMVDSPSPSDEQPLCALDHFYIHALSDIPPDLLMVVKKAFSIICRIPFHIPSLPQLVCLLSLENDAFFPYLKRLAVETEGWRFRRPCSYFRDFLEDPSRSGQFYTPTSESLLHTAHAYLQVIAHCSNLITIMKPQAIRYFQMDQQTHSDEILGTLRENAGDKLCSLAGSMLYESTVEWKLLPWFRSKLLQFDFRCLAHTSDRISSYAIMRILNFLYVLDKANSVTIVRVQPASSSDRQFIDKCEGVVEPMVLIGEAEQERWFFNTLPAYVLLGYESETVLVVLTSRPGKYNRKIKHIEPNIYTLAMLDFM